MKKNRNNNISFESCLKQLEEIVEQLESNNIDLEKSVKLYEKGIELKKICEEKLKKVELQIKKIKLENNNIIKEHDVTQRSECIEFKINKTWYVFRGRDFFFFLRNVPRLVPSHLHFWYLPTYFSVSHLSKFHFNKSEKPRCGKVFSTWWSPRH